ncbi:transcriptional coactivator p15 family protein [Ophiostoma piceae UAMH 11346]|uniref:Transcriptional coactivator p15 family protein n=1 Tax=Ophiostoma piceae (strain UAMH 11346) TaxID=1262450 RepID=S3DAR7_OPHP1|nr:transcriptional coactivator p15 family protein [Ophiostoma piceae UAMH 11346]
MAGKRSYEESAVGSSKLAKGSSSADVSSSKASRGKAPPKSVDADGNAYWELSKMRRIGISHFRNNVLINIREYYDSAGQMRPGKKGISLSLDQYKTLLQAIPDINAALRQEGSAVSEAEDDEGGAVVADKAKDKAAKAEKAKAEKAKAKKSNIEATSDEDSE